MRRILDNIELQLLVLIVIVYGIALSIMFITKDANLSTMTICNIQNTTHNALIDCPHNI